ncbi:MAG TPA: FliH/SctL family protein [Syntrophales bacterium]|nr:FliH/SctL family protein [Syntrophales bacterium]
MSEKVIKSENVDLVSSSQGRKKEFVRFYSHGKGDASRSDGKKGKTGSASNHAGLSSKQEKAESEAYAKGFAEGLRTGADDERRRASGAMEAVTNCMRELDRLKKGCFEENEERILDLVFSVTEKVINREISTNRDVVHGVLRSAIEQVIDKEGIVVRLNPEDYRYMMELNPGLIGVVDDIRNMSIVEDSSVRRGGVVIDTSSGEVDARLEQQLNEVRKAVSGKR